TGEAGFMALFAASLANGGSLDDIEPGIDYFKQLSDKGNLVPTEAEAGTIETGGTPIVVNWDYLPLQWAADLSHLRRDLADHRRLLLRGLAQRGRPAPGGGPPVAGVRLQRWRTEPAARRLCPARPPRCDGQGRHGR